jgi:ribonuclease HII
VPGAAGVDEAGRGPLAGPVVTAAVILPEGFDLTGIDDSKRLAVEDRERLEEKIRRETTWAIAISDVDEIDRLNILWATMQAMLRSIEALPQRPDRLLVDGNRVPRELDGWAEPVIDGDANFACIAAASILAKTERDRMMREYGARYPVYGFENHFGYSTPEHTLALKRHGPCPIHRRSFAPVRESEQRCLIFED